MSAFSVAPTLGYSSTIRVPDERVGLALDVAVGGREPGAERLEAPQVHVDRPGAEVVAAGQRHPGPALAGEQRAEHDDRRPHPLDQLVGRLGGDRRRADDPHARRRSGRSTVHPMRASSSPMHSTSAMAGHVAQHVLAGRQQRGGQQLQHRVLGPGDGTVPSQRATRAGPGAPPPRQYGPGAAVATVVARPPRRRAAAALVAPRRRPRPRAPTTADGALRAATRAPSAPTGARSATSTTAGVEVTVDVLGVGPLFWGLALRPRHAAGSVAPPHRAGRPWWAPPGRLDRRAGARCSACCCSISVVGGYLGTVITQTATFAADEFGVSTGAQSDLLSVGPGCSVLITLVLAALADRIGRRRLVTRRRRRLASPPPPPARSAPSISASGPPRRSPAGFAGALAPAHRHHVGRGDAAGGSRAWALLGLAMCQALGAGMCLWALPLADIGGEGSRRGGCSTCCRCSTSRSSPSCPAPAREPPVRRRRTSRRPSPATAAGSGCSP